MVKGFAGRRVFVEDQERMIGESRREAPTTGVGDGRVPGCMVRVEIAKDEGIVIGMA